MHDVVRIVEVVPLADVGKSQPPAELTVTIPDSTGLVNVRAARGAVWLRDYHGTTIAAVGRGRVTFENVSGDAFVQPLNGHFYAVDSTFDRLRIRSNSADEVFDGCRVTQIEATTLTGNILFDNGMFEPGLARFESDRGSIALGVNGSAQLGAHTQDGHIRTALPSAPGPAPFMSRDDSPDDAAGMQFVGGGGPLVNVSSVHGDLFLYNGSLADRHAAPLAPAWQPMLHLLSANRDRARHPTEVRPPTHTIRRPPDHRRPANGQPIR
jgi:hypothetical protein